MGLGEKSDTERYAAVELSLRGPLIRGGRERVGKRRVRGGGEEFGDDGDHALGRGKNRDALKYIKEYEEDHRYKKPG